jgi:hypothetical protein
MLDSLAGTRGHGILNGTMRYPGSATLVWSALAGLLSAVGSPGAALAQWTATVLTPPGASSSYVWAVSSTHQYGAANGSPAGLAPGYWSGSAGTWTSLVPPEIGGEVRGAAGDQLAGWANGRAAVWNGPSHTLVDLNPTGYAASSVHATTGTWQAGGAATALVASPPRAFAWRGSAASAVLLHPAVAYSSDAAAADRDYQGGWVTYPGPFGPGPEHAAVWRGTAQSFIDLNPPGAIGSQIRGMFGGQSVGSVGPPLGGDDAALWPSIGAPYIRLNPPGVTYASLEATCGSAQVGAASHAQFGSTAAIWLGTPESFVALSPYLPPEYYASVATSVAQANGVYYVGGYAFRSGGTDAVLWVGIPAPGSLVLLCACAGLAACRRRR